MLLSMMRCKLHNATVTECDLYYEGSASVDEALLEASGLLPGEEVHVWNICNGARIVTYLIKEERGSGKIGVNGAAARHFSEGDKIIITSFAQMTPEEAREHRSSVVILGDKNEITSIID